MQSEAVWLGGVTIVVEGRAAKQVMRMGRWAMAGQGNAVHVAFKAACFQHPAIMTACCINGPHVQSIDSFFLK